MKTGSGDGLFGGGSVSHGTKRQQHARPGRDVIGLDRNEITVIELEDLSMPIDEQSVELVGVIVENFGNLIRPSAFGSPSLQGMAKPRRPGQSYQIFATAGELVALAVVDGGIGDATVSRDNPVPKGDRCQEPAPFVRASSYARLTQMSSLNNMLVDRVWRSVTNSGDMRRLLAARGDNENKFHLPQKS